MVSVEKRKKATHLPLCGGRMDGLGFVPTPAVRKSIYETSMSMHQSQLNAPPVWYSMTRVSKKFFSFFRSIISDIHGKGLVAPG